MRQYRFGRVGPILLACTLALPMVTACGGSHEGEGGPAVKRTRGSLRTVQPAPSGRPQKQTASIERGTTGYVGGLRLGVMRAWDDKGTVAVLSGPEISAQSSVTVTGKAGESKRLGNGFTLAIDKVVNAKGDSDKVGSAGGSVTVTVTPPS